VSSAELAGKVALVTGGGRGIGANIARELSSAGMRVAVAARTREQIEEVAAEVGGLSIQLDVTDGEAVAAAVARTEAELGAIDLLVNDAGVQIDDLPLWESDPDEWWRVFDVNVRGPYLTCRVVGQAMANRGEGRIVNVTSGMAWLEVDSRPDASAVYAASKAALHRFSEVLAVHLRPHGVSVFSIDPGLVRTSMTADFPDDAPWAPPEAAPQLIRAIAAGELDALSGRFLHAVLDPPEELKARAAAILHGDLNAIRLQR
jgi:3-oxoacyl-[acyl-carrier protein] reductase